MQLKIGKAGQGRTLKRGEARLDPGSGSGFGVELF
jgi:hypothetical protein